MDLEKNVLNIDNEDGYLNQNEENNLSFQNEVFRENEEHFSINEENDSGLEENQPTSINKKSSGSNDNKTNELNAATNAGSALGASIAIPGVVISLVASVAIIGTTAGTIPSLKSTHVTNFLSTSTSLGFEVSKDEEKTFKIILSNDEYNAEEDLTDRSQYVFSNLKPHTTYNLDVLDTSVEPHKNVYSANYLTKEKDKYLANIDVKSIENNVVSFSLKIEGEGIDFINVEVLGDNAKSLFTYEGDYKEDFDVEYFDNKDVSCRLQINGEMVLFTQLINPDEDFVNVESVSLNAKQITLAPKETRQLVATVLPENASNKSLNWVSTNERVASVNSEGLITANAEGKATIRVTTNDGGFSDECVVTVKTSIIHVTSISIEPEELELIVGESGNVVANVLPEDATDKSVSWLSSNEDIVTVSDGEIYAVSAGEAYVAAVSNDGGLDAKCTVYVSEAYVPVESVELDIGEISLAIGQEKILTATVLPTNATDKSVTWSSDDESVATVSEGIVYAVDEGTAIITVTTVDGDFEATCSVSVTQPVAVEEITLNKESIFVQIGKMSTLTATVLPEDATDKSITWTSSDTSVAIVASNGVVSGMGEGETTVRATSNFDPDIYAECIVNVVAEYIEVKSVTLDQYMLTVYFNHPETLTATVSPQDATNQNIIWTSDDETIATVDGGVITGLKVGTTYIRATSPDGPSNYCSITVKSDEPTMNDQPISWINNITNYGNVVPTINLSYEDPFKVWEDTFILAVLEYEDSEYVERYRFTLTPVETHYAVLRGFYMDGLNDESLEFLISRKQSPDLRAIVYAANDPDTEIARKNSFGYTDARAQNPIPGSIIIDENVVGPTGATHPSFHIDSNTSLTGYDSIDVSFVGMGYSITVDDATIGEILTIYAINLATGSNTFDVTVTAHSGQDTVTIITETIEILMQ